MCGLTGFSGEGKASPDKLKLLMLWNFFERGKDATGIYSPKQGLIKSCHDARSYMKELSEIDDNLFIGHVRASTIGNNTSKNAHPFHIGNIVLAHNGTLTDYFDLAKDLEMKNKDWDVDSQILAYGLNKFPTFDVLNMFYGAAALLWVDTRRPERLLAFRNPDRPLFRGKAKEGMYISSIGESLTAIGCTDVKEFTENNVYSIHNGKVEFLVKTHPKKAPVVTYKQQRLGFSAQELQWLDPSEFKDTWIKLSDNICRSWNIPNNTWVYCLGEADKDGKIMLSIIDEKGDQFRVSKYCVDWDDYEIEDRSWVKIICNNHISYRSSNRIFCMNGDYLQVISTFDNGECTLRNISTNETATISRKYFRKAQFKEMEVYFMERRAKREKDEEEIKEKRTVRLRNNIKFTPKMMELINSILERVEDKVVLIKDKAGDNKELLDKCDDLLKLIDKEKFSIEESLAQD